MEAFAKIPYADLETSSAEYAARFDGQHGQWLLEVQTECLLELCACLERPFEELSFLDVGGGHGQVARELLSRGAKVTVLSSAEACHARLGSLRDHAKCSLAVADLLDTGLAARSFDVVTCVRLLSHIQSWETLVGELCRLAGSVVIVDYPPQFSFNLFYPLLFWAKRHLEGNTRSYTVFRHIQIDRAFERHGFHRVRRKAEFFWPMVIHRVIKSRRVSLALEYLAGRIGLRQLFGSPVVAMYLRSGPRA